MNIYIVLISTDTKMGSLIKLATHYKYNHVAVSLDSDLKKMYSFARYKEKSALVGGFINEKSSRYKNPPHIKVFKLNLSEKSYNEVEKMIEQMRDSFNKYIYNTYSAILFPIKKSIKIKDSYTCFEFAKKVLEQTEYKQVKTIKELDQKLVDSLIFDGSMDDYIKMEYSSEDEYFEKLSRRKIAVDTVTHFIELSKRFFNKK